MEVKSFEIVEESVPATKAKLTAMTIIIAISTTEEPRK